MVKQFSQFLSYVGKVGRREHMDHLQEGFQALTDRKEGSGWIVNSESDI